MSDMIINGNDQENIFWNGIDLVVDFFIKGY